MLREHSRRDRPSAPEWLSAKEQAWARKVGCCGCTHGCCTCCCCEAVEHTVRVGPADSITALKDKAFPCCCTRSLEVLGTTVDKVDLVSAETPVGCCAVVGNKPNFGDCSCSCSEQAVLTVANDPDHPIAVTVNAGDAEAATADVISRVLANPALGAEETLRTYVSQHPCYGRKGEVVITNKRVTFTGFRLVPNDDSRRTLAHLDSASP